VARPRHRGSPPNTFLTCQSREPPPQLGQCVQSSLQPDARLAWRWSFDGTVVGTDGVEPSQMLVYAALVFLEWAGPLGVLQVLKCATHRRHHVGAVLEGGKGAISGGQGSDPSLTGTFASTRFSWKARPNGSGGPRTWTAALHQLRSCWRNILTVDLARQLYSVGSAFRAMFCARPPTD
jgi:hypothetical protein